jgi:YD repeat-containing protein
MSKLKQTKIPVTSGLDEFLQLAVEQGVIENEFNWKLVRERDGLTNQSKEVMWVEWNEEGRFKSKHDEPAVGRSLMMSPFNQFFTWQTTTLTEIVEERDDYIKFKTQNSNYELWKLKNNR